MHKLQFIPQGAINFSSIDILLAAVGQDLHGQIQCLHGLLHRAGCPKNFKVGSNVLYQPICYYVDA